MKILFLDIDGVMNTMELLTPENGYRYICPERVKLLKHIVDETGCKIVLSSAWRTAKRERNMVREALAKENLKFISETPITCAYPRCNEIMEWLMMAGQTVEDYVILDDWEDAGIKGHFFHTHEDVGLTPEMTEDIISYLNRNNK